MESGYQIGAITKVLGWFPGIFQVGVSKPGDKVLNALLIVRKLGVKDSFNFIVIGFLINDFGWGSWEVRAMGCGFLVWFKQGIVEYGMDPPCPR